MTGSDLFLFPVLMQIAPFAIVLGVGGQILAILSSRKKNGSVIWKPTCANVSGAIAVWFPILVMVAIALMSGTWTSVLVLLLIALFSVPALARSLRSLHHGIYQDRVVGKEFVSTWKDIEMVVVRDDRLSLVDRTRGAMDFEMESTDIGRLIPILSSYCAVSLDERTAD